MAGFHRLRLPVELAMFSAVIGVMLFVLGVGIAAVVGLNGGFVPFFIWMFIVVGFFLLAGTVAAYFLGIVQFVRQNDVEYDSFFGNLPIESPNHPEDFGEMYDDFLVSLTRRWPWLLVLLPLLILIVKGVLSLPVGVRLLMTDLGPVHNGGERWNVREVAAIGGGSIILSVIVALMIRRIWAMQFSDLIDPPEQ